MVDSVYPRPGRLIADKYQLDAMIGEGAMGTVWAATHINLNQRVAVKLILPELADSESVRQRFEAEAKAAAALRSRFVVQVYDSGINDEGVPYLVMEYLTGESLEEMVERSGPLPLEFAVQIIAQVAKGLARAHSRGIVHRDLKPANVFMAQTDDGEEVAKILDFGIAKFQKEGPAVSATATGTVVGTPLFMSPEQARGQKGIDHRSDLYSLGGVAFYALTGSHAFGSEALGELILAICIKPLPSLVARRPGLPAGLDAWYHKACARDPNDRFQSAEEMVGALVDATGLEESVLRAAGVVTRRTDFGGRLSMQSSPEFGSGTSPGMGDSGEQRAAVEAATLASAPGGPSGAVETLMVGATHPGVSRTSPSEPPGRRRAPLLLIAGGLAFAAVGIVVAVLVMASGRRAEVSSTASAGDPLPVVDSAGAAVSAEPGAGADPVAAPAASAEGQGHGVVEDAPEAKDQGASDKPESTVPPAAPTNPRRSWTQRRVGGKPITARPATSKSTGAPPATDKPAAEKPAGKPNGSDGIDIGF